MATAGVFLGTGAAALTTVFAPAASAASFGWSDDGTNYVVNTGADLVFKVNHSDGDLVSLVYKGVEHQGYAGDNSQVESGLGASTVSISQSGSTILVKVVHETLTHYYAARSGENNVYMWTNKGDDTVTATRYIVRTAPGVFPNTGSDCWNSTTMTLIEAQDVFKDSSGETHAKHYSKLRTIDYDYVGFTTGSLGMWMVRSNHEKASGGPFYRSLLRHSNEQGVGIYEILYYGENQTEAERFGLQGPYVLAFTDGGAPSSSLYHANMDTSWVDGLGITGWVGTSGRGAVAGVGLGGMDSAYTYTVGFANSAAQYWATAAASSGAYECAGMLPGTYTLTVYKDELAVYTTTVAVSAGATTALHTITITADPSTTTALWRIGDWTGTPSEFKNADLMTYAHPSDSRASAWTGNFIVGTSAADAWPCYQWNDVNDGMIVYFKLTSAQIAAAHTLNIGVTTAYANGRPQIVVNDWTSSIPSPNTEPTTRSLTVGSYRGNNHTYSYSIPASAWLNSTSSYQVLKINIVSGDTGSDYLSPGVSYDCIELLN